MSLRLRSLFAAFTIVAGGMLAGCDDSCEDLRTVCSKCRDASVGEACRSALEKAGDADFGPFAHAGDACSSAVDAFKAAGCE